MAEISERGPIACTVAVTSEFENYSGGIFRDATGAKSLDHSISVVGYGTSEDGVDYWIGRNSWGGFFFLFFSVLFSAHTHLRRYVLG